MKLDPTKMADWEVAEAAEVDMRSLDELAESLGLAYGELLPVGWQLAKIDYMKILKRLKDKPRGKYIDVTAITPTPLGEGKTTTAIGLVEGMGKLGKRVAGALRQGSSGPTFNIKGAAAGGGLAQCIPMSKLAVKLTGDVDSITNAHNLAMVALTARMQHENNYDDEKLAKRGLKRLDVDPERVQMKWALDFCAQSLRSITIGQGGKMDGFEMQSGAQITASSEVMAIVAVAKDMRDLRERIGKIVVAFDKQGKEVTTADLEVDGAMTAWLVDVMNPNLVQTIEGQPVLIHAGPFANIAIGQSSIIADLVGTKLVDYLVTESGFGADIGFEKFWNIKCRMSGLRPDAVVIVATIRALKMHGGGPTVKPGAKLSEEYTREHVELVEAGCGNLISHIETVRKCGVRPVVCLNHFYTDTDAEIEVVRKSAEANGAIFAVSKHWEKGGDGAIELAEAVIQACEEEKDFEFLYEQDMPLKAKIERIVTEVYGGSGVSYSELAEKKLKYFALDEKFRDYSVCMVKTHLSLSHDPVLKNRPVGFEVPIRDVLVYEGAELIVPLAGGIQLMPGTGSDPAYRRIDIDVETGKIQGMF